MTTVKIDRKPRYMTRKRTNAGKAETLRRREIRAAKYQTEGK